VDGLCAAKYSVAPANPAKIEQYSGLKHSDDTSDAYLLAELLGILPTGYIYDVEPRPVRDLLRRRLSLVHQRTALMLSFKSLFARTTRQEMSLSRLKWLSEAEVKGLYEHPANELIAQLQHQHIEALTGSIERSGVEGGAAVAQLWAVDDAAGSGSDPGADNRERGRILRPATWFVS